MVGQLPTTATAKIIMQVVAEDSEELADALDAWKLANSVWCGGLPGNVLEGNLRYHFQPFGEITNICIKHIASHAYTYAFVQYKNKQSVEEAVNRMDGAIIKGKKVTVAVAGESSREASMLSEGHGHEEQSFMSAGAAEFYPSNRVWCGGLPRSVMEGHLRYHFEEFGEITDVWIHPDDRKDYAYAFIQYKNKQSAGKAVDQMDHARILRRNVRVAFAHSRRAPPRFASSQDSFAEEFQIVRGHMGDAPVWQ